MNKKWKITLTILVIVSVVSLASIYKFVLQRPQPHSSVYTSFSGEIDATTIVSQVIDGDTFDTTSEGRIRLADVDAPEFRSFTFWILGVLLLALAIQWGIRQSNNSTER